MDKRKLDKVDENAVEICRVHKNSLERFMQKLKQKKAYDDTDPTNISIIPRIISKKENLEINSMCKKITHSAFRKLSDYLEDTSIIPSSPLNDFLKKLPINQDVLTGVARFDFLKEEEDYKLIEMNFLNIGSLRYIIESQNSLFEIFPELTSFFYSINPIDFSRKMLKNQGVENVLLMSKNLIEGAPNLLVKHLSPLEVKIVTYDSYKNIDFENGKIRFDGKTFDSIYPRFLSGSKGDKDELIENYELVFKILNSNSLIFDSWNTMILEEKDLRYTFSNDEQVKRYIPEIFDINELENEIDYSNYVLKIRDLHSGRGVFVSPDINQIKKNNVILQKRIKTNKYPVHTILGDKGNAVYDTGVHIAYCYNLNSKELNDFEIAGYLTRFSLNGDIVNMQKGGGLIPTLIER